MESFFSPLQKNVLNRKRWRTREQLRLAIVTWIQRTYQRRRRSAVSASSPPIEFEMLFNEVAQAA
jgi:putative transposase